jgi:hypothetical protein
MVDELTRLAGNLRIDRVRVRGRCEEPVAVLGPLGDEGAADGATCAGAVVHVHHLAKLLAQGFGHDARRGIRTGSRGPGHDDRDRPAGVGLGTGPRGRQGGRRRGGELQAGSPVDRKAHLHSFLFGLGVT